jgi:hypothetical protein
MRKGVKEFTGKRLSICAFSAGPTEDSLQRV